MDKTRPTDAERIAADAERIVALGGPTKVAELMGFDKAKGGPQRVQNWISRGIPPAVKLDRPDLFLLPLPESATADAQGG